MTTIERYMRWMELGCAVVEIAHGPGPWEVKFEIILGDHGLIDQMKEETELPFDWTDPDLDYEDDVRAVADAVQSRVEEIALTLKPLERVLGPGR